MGDLYVTTRDGLSELCETLGDQDWIAVDTEFLREKTYRPLLCLIQVATEGVVACVDPLALDDLSPLLEVLHRPDITKILHSARQDMEIFFQYGGALPAPLFDTQIAATVLGFGEQVGYGPLVEAMLGVSLDKSHTRTDWSRRPLSPEQLQYAGDDVRYLGPIYRAQLARLKEKNRLDWLSDDLAALVDPATYTVRPETLWRRVKGVNRLKGVQLSVLQAVAAWREELAVATNRPRRWVLKDEAALELAKQMPNNLARMERIPSLDVKTIKRHGKDLLALIDAARRKPEAQWPTLAHPHRPEPGQEALVDALMAILRQRGWEQEVSPSLIASRHDLERLVTGDDTGALMRGWRAAMVGNDLTAFLAGRLTLRHENGHLQLHPVPEAS